jgi:hypothetical protein
MLQIIVVQWNMLMQTLLLGCQRLRATECVASKPVWKAAWQLWKVSSCLWGVSFGHLGGTSLDLAGVCIVEVWMSERRLQNPKWWL